MSSVKKLLYKDIEVEQTDVNQKITTLLQFARKAGLIAYGFEACKKSITTGNIKMLLLTADIAANTKDKIMQVMETTGCRIVVSEFSNQQELSAALGLPYTCIIGILDINFAKKIQSYLTQ